MSKIERMTSMTREQLAELAGLPRVHKEAIEHAIRESTPDPADGEWPDRFRAEEANCMLDCLTSDDDVLEDGRYVMDCMWFEAGWKAAKADSGT